eukprot:COSAG03_NODE_1128_length_4764_cov_647.303751_1_plen_108_part_00
MYASTIITTCFTYQNAFDQASTHAHTFRDGRRARARVCGYGAQRTYTPGRPAARVRGASLSLRRLARSGGTAAPRACQQGRSGGEHADPVTLPWTRRVIVSLSMASR